MQGAFISPLELQVVTSYIRKNCEVCYNNPAVIYAYNGNHPKKDATPDALYIEALRAVVINNVASISFIQRKCQVGYNRAGAIIEWMEDMGYISPFDGEKTRKVLITKEEFESKYGPL